MSNDATNKWSKTQAVAAAATTASLLSPQILRHCIKAQGGRGNERASHLRLAIEKTEQLLAKLKLAELAHGWRDKNVA